MPFPMGSRLFARFRHAMYADDEFLALSGIQHFSYCRRQWVLIHIEQMWAGNIFTTLGDMMHERAHDESIRERRGDMLIVRGMTVRSPRLGVWGMCDVVEFHAAQEGHPLYGEDGLWLPVPIEYKRGKSKDGNEDRLQLCAQAMCLEDMLACDVPFGFLYYGATRSREHVELTAELRGAVEAALDEMHRLYDRRHVPNVRRGVRCRGCSLIDLCMPRVQGQKVENYMSEMLGGA